MKGFHGRLLRVDLGSETFREEAIPLAVLERCLGGKGLGSYLLLDNVGPGVDPLGPENRLIFAVGPATGTRVPGSSRYGVYGKSPQTGGYAESYAGGKVAPQIKAAGYDAVILEGRAREPVLLEVSDRGINFHPARDLWGKETYAAEDAALERVGVPGAQAVVIGPAGENGVRLACLENNYWRSAGRGGLGAVMGSKNVKAVVFHGRTLPPVADEAALKKFTVNLVRAGKDHPAARNYRKYGTPMMVSVINSVGAFPARYWSRGVLEGWEKIGGEALLEDFQVRPRACPNCFLACGKLTTVRQGPRAGMTIEGPEYETIYAFGGLCCIGRLEDIIYLNDLCDRLGLDTISAGNLVALAMEARERGLDPGLPAYGDAAGAGRLLVEMACRQGRGALFADGIVPAAKALNLEDVAVHVKGLEPAGYDPRFFKGVGLGYATSARGACHLRATFYKPELAGIIPPRAVEGKAALYVDFEDRLTIFNTLILCVFFRDMLPWEELQVLIEALTGRAYSTEELRRAAGGIIAMSRRFNLRQGLGRESDALPARFHRQPLPESGAVLPEDEFAQMLGEYYKLRGWE
ncbi:MAG: aldehyde ferredoxin oxidoreductase family protein [Peptococcaceae bacterium]|nr:aldehyde ferredoxin oxidoreductase family protein [Peptococcaceae bacterium]